MSEEKPGFLSFRVRPWGLLSVGGFVLCVSTIFGFLGRFSWFLDLFSHFRVQYLLSLLIIGLIFLAGKKRRKAAAVLLTFAGINLVVVLPYFFGDRSTAPGPEPALRAMLLNVNTRLGDPERVRQAIENIDPDILVLEEISAQWELDLEWLEETHPHSRVRTREDNFGIGLFSKFPLVDDEIFYASGDAPSILATVETGQGPLRVLATHPLPPSGANYSKWRNAQFEELPDYVKSPFPLILLGDLNVTPWNFHFKRLLDRSGLIDSSKGHGIQPTWPCYLPMLLIPLDHCLHSAGIRVLSRKVGPNVGSDHYPLIVDFVLEADQSTQTANPKKRPNGSGAASKE